MRCNVPKEKVQYRVRQRLTNLRQPTRYLRAQMLQRKLPLLTRPQPAFKPLLTGSQSLLSAFCILNRDPSNELSRSPTTRELAPRCSACSVRDWHI